MFNQYIDNANSTNEMSLIDLLSASYKENHESTPSNTVTDNSSGRTNLNTAIFNNETTEEITEARSDANTTTINEQLVILTEEIKRLKEHNFPNKSYFKYVEAKMRQDFNQQIAQKRKRADEAEQENDRLRTEVERLKKKNAELNKRIADTDRFVIKRMLYPNSITYIGQLKDNRPHGWGKMIFRSKTILRSNNWNNGQCHGYGTIIWPSGDKYVGQFKNFQRNGKGTYYFSDGCKHVGEWKDNTQHGRGVFTFADGKKHEGEWIDGNEHGRFTLTMPYGLMRIADYDNGEEVSSTPIVAVNSSANPQWSVSTFKHSHGIGEACTSATGVLHRRLLGG